MAEIPPLHRHELVLLALCRVCKCHSLIREPSLGIDELVCTLSLVSLPSLHRIEEREVGRQKVEPTEKKIDRMLSSFMGLVYSMSPIVFRWSWTACQIHCRSKNNELDE